MGGGVTPRPRPDAPGPCGHGTRGFSLIELVVATAVLAVLTAGVTLSAVSRPAAGDARVFAARLSEQTALARLGRVRRGLRITPDALQPVIWRPASETTPGAWVENGRARGWRRAVVFNAPAGAGFTGDPQIVLRGDAPVPAFTLTFRDGGECSSEADLLWPDEGAVDGAKRRQKTMGSPFPHGHYWHLGSR